MQTMRVPGGCVVVPTGPPNAPVAPPVNGVNTTPVPPAGGTVTGGAVTPPGGTGTGNGVTPTNAVTPTKTVTPAIASLPETGSPDTVNGASIAPASTSSLPFTGADIEELAGLGIAAVLFGGVMVRRRRRTAV
jgi:hypothetical protein